jgi:uncharacterized membrane protein
LNSISSNAGRADRSLRTQRFVGLALFAAIVVVLQIVATYVRIGTFSVTLVLVPIVVGAAVYGPKAGAFLGGVFGIVVTIGCITGADSGGYILWTDKPVVTVLLCLAKGILAGLAAGAVFRALARKHMYAGVIVAAIICPIINTGIFCVALALLYHETLVAWAAGTELLYYVLVGLTGINFLIEMLINVVLSPVIIRIIKIRRSV